MTIVSGGQSGVDRGALDAALEAGAPCGGWCPEGRWAEDGTIPDRYPLKEWPGGCEERTLQNVIDSDGTLILHRETLTGGTAYTLNCCREQDQPVLVLDTSQLGPDDCLHEVLGFMERHGIRTLNVAGPRESGWPGAHAISRALVNRLLAQPDVIV